MTRKCPDPGQCGGRAEEKPLGPNLADENRSGSNAGSEPSADGLWPSRSPSPAPAPTPAPAPAEVIPGDGPILLLCDHASNAVPPDIDLCIATDLLDRHIAVDIGAGPLTRALAAAIGAPALLGPVSRLVIDLHREPDHPGLIPDVSDGHAIPGNIGADRQARLARFHAPYHRAVAAQVRSRRPALIVAVHSFTPQLEAGNTPARRWEAGVLYNRSRLAAEPALGFLAAEGLIVGDNEPYSGRHLNMTLNRHAEAQGIPSLSVEVRNDLIQTAEGVSRWTGILARMVAEVRNGLARNRPPAT